MRHKTSGYFLLSALLVSLILGLCILLNLRCPQAVSDDALTQEQLTRGVTLTGWQQTGPGHWRFAFEAPADVPELVLCLSTRSLDAVPEGLEPTDQRGEAFWVRPVPGRTSEITVTSTTVPQMWLMLPDTLWHWRELRSSLQLMALVAFASMGAGILALFCFKPKHELGVFLLYLGVMFGWGLAVLFPAGQTGALLGFLMGLYFPFAVLTPIWLCCSLLHVALPRRGSRHFALSVLATLLFLMLGTSTQTVLRSVTLQAGMAMVLVVLAQALAKKERPAWYLLAGYILTFGLRLTIVLPSFRFWFYRESFPFYMVRCARLYDIPFTLGCLVFVSRRYALQFDRTEQLAQELEARKDAYQAELEAFVAHGQNWAEAQQAQADREVSIKAEQAEREKAIDAQRLEGALSLAGGMADAMKQIYESGLAQSKGVYQLYQALAIAEATISTYKAAQAAYAQGMEWGGPVVGAIMAATAVAAGMARVAAIKSTPLKGFAFGGLIGGQDKGERADNVLIRATPGEYMLDRPTVRHYGVSALEALRRRSVPRELLEPFASPRLPASGGKRTAYALGGEIGNGSLTEGGKASGNEGLTVINVMDFQREFDRALASTRGRRVLINILGEEGIAS